MIGWIIALVVLGALGIGGGIGRSKLMKEHREARNVPLADIDFS